ncbi:MAG: NAD(P)H-dependent oxidoreductase subunit E [Betaproteobacteria bacterium]|nr:NAD(P)H-dependent oxidoreductase subunit E [Betaproteobacteria bacterium]
MIQTCSAVDNPDSVLKPILARHGANPTRLVQILREVQERAGHVSDDAVTALAAALGIPRVRVEGVASFYSFFRRESHGAYEILLSDNITDHMQGKKELMQYLCEKLWIEPGKVSEDGLVSVWNTSDTGICDQGPAALVNGYAVPALSRNRIDLMVELMRAKKSLADWPPMLFEVRDNIRKPGVLLGQPFEPGSALETVIARGASATLKEMERSKLRGRGGAGFPTAVKWASCSRAAGKTRYVVCNADEGEPGTFKDRVLLTSYADLVFEGMTVCARVIGAAKGLVYLRGEYRYLLERLEAALEARRRANLLGSNILGEKGFDFDIEIHLGAGAYICGEESALIESLEGKRGQPRNRPPYPDTHGYLGEPTAVDNVETFACSALIAKHGGDWFAGIGTAESSGTKLLSVSGDVKRPGIYEYPFGVTVREVLRDCGAASPQAVQISGPSGSCISWKEFDRRIAFEDLPTAGAFMVFSRERDMFEVARNFSHFFAHESCGFCTPCRVGTTLLRKTMDKIHAGHGSAYDMDEMRHLSRILKTMSHCGLGHTAANPVVDTMAKFPDAYERKLKELAFEPSFDLDGALDTARRITGRDDPWAHIGEEP